MSDSLRMRRELVEAYRAYQEDPYEPLLLQNYIRLLSRYKTDPETVDFLKNMRLWSGSRIVYDYSTYSYFNESQVWVGINLIDTHWRPDFFDRAVPQGEGWSGQYMRDVEAFARRYPHMDPELALPVFEREELKRNSVYWTEDASYVLVNAETWPGERLPNEVSSFFDSPYHGEVNLVSVHGGGERRWTVLPKDVTSISVGRADMSRLHTLRAALAFGLVRADMTYDSYEEVEVPEP